MSTAAGPVRKALKPAIIAAIADTTVQVELGYPWPQTAADIVAVGPVRSELTAATMTPQRTRDETLTAEVLISVFRPGGQEVEEIASDRAYELMDAIEHYIRMTDPTLGGLLMWLFVTAHEADSAPYSDDTTQGRTVEISVTLTGRARTRN